MPLKRPPSTGCWGIRLSRTNDRFSNTIRKSRDVDGAAWLFLRLSAGISLRCECLTRRDDRVIYFAGNWRQQSYLDNRRDGRCRRSTLRGGHIGELVDVE